MPAGVLSVSPNDIAISDTRTVASSTYYTATVGDVRYAWWTKAAHCWSFRRGSHIHQGASGANSEDACA